jgi:aspartyl aminopeptidase
MADLADAVRLCAFIDAAPSPYHAVAEAIGQLHEAGFVAVDERGPFPDAPRGYVARGGTLVAWLRPEGAPAHLPARLVGAHTDSPNLRVKPHPDTGSAGWRQLAVEVYGGALLNSWLDRDLGLSGRVSVRTPEGPQVRLVRIDRPLLRVPQLAIHLDRGVNEGLRLDPQQHLRPVWGLGPPTEGAFAELLAGELGVGPGDVLAWEAMLHDLTPSCLLGRDEELISAPRIDNLASCYAAVEALAAAGRGEPGAQPSMSVVCLFDHEEVGSQTATGAAGPVLATVLERVVAAAGGDRDALHRALAGSRCVSADGAHATHPNYPERHEPGHRIAANGGPVLKVNSNARYATDAGSAGWLAVAAEEAGVPLQRFVTRSDLPCGSTIGPVTAAQLGIPTVDVGIPQLSMHSARELCGAHDPGALVALLTAFLRS